VSASADGLRGLICIVSYDLMSKMADEAQKKNYRVVIADEAHYLKSGDTKRVKVLAVRYSLSSHIVKVMIPLLRQAKRACLISGTPSLSRPQELFNLVRLFRVLDGPPHLGQGPCRVTRPLSACGCFTRHLSLSRAQVNDGLRASLLRRVPGALWLGLYRLIEPVRAQYSASVDGACEAIKA
jgi:hypothetical protein